MNQTAMRRHGVVVIHGIGTGRTRGAQLAEAMNGVADLLEEAGGTVARWFDAAMAPARCSLAVTPPGGATAEVIEGTEAFWDDAFPSQRPRIVLRWLLRLGPRQIADIAAGLVRDPANDQPADESEPGPRADYLAGWFQKWVYRAELALIWLALIAAYALSWVAAPLLWVLYALSETPGLRLFGLWGKLAEGLHGLDPFLGGSLGDTQRFLEDGMWSANIRRVLEETVAAYVRDPGIADVTIIAHSQGAAVAYDALRAGGPIGEAMGALSAPKRLTLSTVGSGVNRNFGLSNARPANTYAGRLPQQPFDSRITGVAPTGDLVPASSDEEKLRLRARFYWLDIYARLDSVPAGGLREEVRRAARLDPCQVKRRQVVNTDSSLNDHGGYFRNGDLVVPRLVRAIYGGEYPWVRPPGSTGPTPELTPQRVRRRIDRVAVLQLMRLLLVGSVALHLGLLLWSERWRSAVSGWLDPLLTKLPLVSDLYDGGAGTLGGALPVVLAAALGGALALALLRAVREWWFADL